MRLGEVCLVVRRHDDGLFGQNAWYDGYVCVVFGYDVFEHSICGTGLHFLLFYLLVLSYSTFYCLTTAPSHPQHPSCSEPLVQATRNHLPHAM